MQENKGECFFRNTVRMNAQNLLYMQEVKSRNTYEIPKDDGMIVHQRAAVQTFFTMLLHQHLYLFT